ncbi:MAG: cell division protein ZapA [Bacteroidales bacterium]|nr:cell division protein ZapA [Bacteroidales bacterium]MBO5075206.1 cell division protein ZapA [Bacteroidales bacterium]
MAQNITIKLGDRPYSLIATSPEQEQLIRKAAEEVNRRIKVYQDRTPEKPMLELMSFAALNICMANLNYQDTFRSLSSEEKRLTKELESYLENIDKNSR